MEFDVEKSVVFVSFLTSFFAVFLAAGIVIGVPAIASEFGMNNVLQNWIITISLLVVAVFTLPAGQISGKFGVKKSLIAGVIVFLIGSIGACLAFSSESFLFFQSNSRYRWSIFQCCIYGYGCTGYQASK